MDRGRWEMALHWTVARSMGVGIGGDHGRWRDDVAMGDGDGGGSSSDEMEGGMMVRS